MNRLFFTFLGIVLLLSCSKKVEADDIDKMNGYWEIEKVVLPNGKEKKYGANEMYEFFQIKDFTGIRKKVTPIVDGTFLVNLDAEKVSIKQGKDNFVVHYTTFYSQWDEDLISISSDKMILRNENKTEYHYKRAKPMKLIKDDKKTK